LFGTCVSCKLSIGESFFTHSSVAFLCVPLGHLFLVPLFSVFLLTSGETSFSPFSSSSSLPEDGDSSSIDAGDSDC
jgi:hypothetical protein